MVTLAYGVYYVTDLVTGQINQSCVSLTNIYGNNIDATGYAIATIGSDSSFSYDQTYAGSVGTDPARDHLKITGHFNGAIAAGTLQLDTTFTDGGTTYQCTSNPQSWTAARTGP